MDAYLGLSYFSSFLSVFVESYYAILVHGSSVKQVSFYDDDVRFWQLWRNQSAAAESAAAAGHVTSTFTSPAASTKGRHFLVICCENKAIFLDLVTMRGRDVPKQELDNRSLLWQVLNPSSSFFCVIQPFGLLRFLTNLIFLNPPKS